MIKFIKKLFKICDHNWEVKERCIVHYPDYEPHKVRDNIEMCKM